MTTLDLICSLLAFLCIIACVWVVAKFPRIDHKLADKFDYLYKYYPDMPWLHNIIGVEPNYRALRHDMKRYDAIQECRHKVFEACACPDKNRCIYNEECKRIRKRTTLKPINSKLP